MVRHPHQLDNTGKSIANVAQCDDFNFSIVNVLFQSQPLVSLHCSSLELLQPVPVITLKGQLLTLKLPSQ